MANVILRLHTAGGGMRDEPIECEISREQFDQLREGAKKTGVSLSHYLSYLIVTYGDDVARQILAEE